jgi:hypothetical protein
MPEFVYVAFDYVFTLMPEWYYIVGGIFYFFSFMIPKRNNAYYILDLLGFLILWPLYIIPRLWSIADY